MSPALRKLDNGDIFLIGHHSLNCHMIFDDKMDNLCRKNRLMAGGHMTEPPTTIIYMSIVSGETPRLL